MLNLNIATHWTATPTTRCRWPTLGWVWCQTRYGLLFMTQMGVELNTIPDLGTGPAMNALLGGQVNVWCVLTPETVLLIKSGRLRVYGLQAKVSPWARWSKKRGVERIERSN